MTKDELLAVLRKCAESDDPERRHAEADDALLAYLHDTEIKEAYDAIGKWYS